MSKTIRLSVAALFATALSGQAFAVCPAVASGPLGPGADIIAAEGPLSAIDTVGRTIEVAGSCFEIPVGMLIDNNADGVGDITLDQLADPALYSPLGGTVILNGTAAVVGGNLVNTTTDVFFEFGEHVLGGPLTSVDAVGGTFMVMGTTVTMNTDPRLPADLWDLGGNAIDVADMVGFEGSLVSAQGYFRAGVLYGTLVETEVIVTVAGSDTVSISRADYRASKRSVDVRGQVTPHSTTGAFATTVSIDLGCNGTIENTATVIVDPVLNLGDWRWTSGNNVAASNPGTVCVTSPLGGTASRTFFVR